MKKSTKQSTESGMAHIVTVGMTPPGQTSDYLVDSLAEDLNLIGPSHLVILSTADSRENADRLASKVALDRSAIQRVDLSSAQSIDEAYRVTSTVIRDLGGRGFQPDRVVVHYTGGTKVMSAGVVLAAVSRECHSLRYLYSQGRGKKSLPIETAPRAVRADRDIRLARLMMRELRFRAAETILAESDPALLSTRERSEYEALRSLAGAYADWDNFRIRGFLKRYRVLRNVADLAPDFSLGPDALSALGEIARVEQSEGDYPIELVIDLFNNAIRRLMERHTDDSLTRLYRAAELFAQSLLQTHFRIRTDDMDVRRVPPRDRVRYEALRRMEDGKIKLGLRKSYELLALLGHPVGKAFEERERFQSVLEERRNLVLAHGTKPCPMPVALQLLAELQAVFEIEVPDFARRARAAQFPWIDNGAVLARLRGTPAEPAAAPAAVESPQAPADARKGGGRGGRSRRGSRGRR